MQPPKQMPPLLFDCLRYFLHIGQQLQESRRQQQRQAAIILEQQQQQQQQQHAASSLSTDQEAHDEKPAEEKQPKVCTVPGFADPVEQSPEMSKTADDVEEAIVASHAADSDGDRSSQPGPDESTDTSKPQQTDDTLSECTSGVDDDHAGKSKPRTAEGKGAVKMYLNGRLYFPCHLVERYRAGFIVVSYAMITWEL